MEEVRRLLQRGGAMRDHHTLNIEGGDAIEQLLDRQLLAELRVERVVEAMRADAGDAAAGAEDVDSRLGAHQGTRTTLPKKSRESTTRCASAACESGNALWM